MNRPLSRAIAELPAPSAFDRLVNWIERHERLVCASLVIAIPGWCLFWEAVL